MTEALHTLLEQTERQRDLAHGEVLQAEDMVRRLEAQAEQLQSYRVESLQRNPAQSGRSTTIEMLRYHQGFMQRLDQAIAQQQHQLQAARNRVAALRDALLDLEMRVASVRKLLERRATETRQREDKREQRVMDDMASRSRRLVVGNDTSAEPPSDTEFGAWRDTSTVQAPRAAMRH